MFSAWDFTGWMVSVGIVLCILSVLTGFGALVHALMSRIWGEEQEFVATPELGTTAKEHPVRKAA